MKPFQIEALRDFAIEHLESAQNERRQAQKFGLSQQTHFEGLLWTAMATLNKNTSTAIEAKAANLLRLTMAILLTTDYERNPDASDRAIEEAKELCILTGRVIPWLDSLPTPAAPSAPTAPCDPPAPVALEKQSTLEPGQYLTTAEAAIALGMQKQTLLNWASKQSGPIKPISKVGRHHRWQSDDIIVLLSGKK